MTKRILALVLCLTIIVGEIVFFPAPVKADTSQTQIQPYYKDIQYDKNVPTGTTIPVDGNVTNIYADGQVELSKSINATNVENEFDITLNIVTKTIATDPGPVDAAVTIVLDLSTSMKDNDRKAMKDAVKAFIQDLHDKANGGKRYVSIITYATNVTQVDMDTSKSGNQYWVDVSTDSITTNLVKTDGIVDKLSDSGYTNTQGGLWLAKTRMEESPVNDVKKRFVVLMTDGIPNRVLINNSGTQSTAYNTTKSNYTKWHNDTIIPNWTNNEKYAVDKQSSTSVTLYDEYIYSADRATLVADYIKNTLNIPIYAIGYGDGINNWLAADDDLASVHRYQSISSTGYTSNKKQLRKGSDWLKDDIATKGFYYDADSSSLATQFSDINDVINRAAEAWQVTDPMGEGIQFLGIYDKDQLISDSDAERKFSTKVDDNGTINWDLTGIEPVPGKDKDGATIFTYTLKYRIKLDTLTDGFTSQRIFKANGETSVNYVLYENGKEKDRQTGTFNIPAVKGYVTPDKAVVDLHFTKVDGQDPNKAITSDSIFTITAQNDSTWCKTIKDSDDGKIDGKLTFEDLPSGQHYYLTEIKAPDGYKKLERPYTLFVSFGELQVYDDLGNPIDDTDNFDFPNENYTLPVTKVWNDNNNANGKRPSSIEVKLDLGSGKSETGVLKSDNNWTYVFGADENSKLRGLLVEDTDYSSKITETYTSDITYSTEIVKLSDGSYQISNSLSTQINVVKEFDPSNSSSKPSSVTVLFLLT